GSESPEDNFNPTRPHAARVYDYLLGGKNNFAADREVGDQIIARLPEDQVGEAGVTQLLNIASGLPTSDNVHEIAQRAVPGTRVVYVDNDPVVLAHARAILSDETATFAEPGNLLDPASIVSS